MDSRLRGNDGGDLCGNDENPSLPRSHAQIQTNTEKWRDFRKYHAVDPSGTAQLPEKSYKKD